MIPEEAVKLIGKADNPRVYEVEKGAIKKYADAIEDRNPLYWDEEYARNSRYGSLIAPPSFYGWPVKWTEAMPFITTGSVGEKVTAIMAKSGYPLILDGGVEFEFMLPVRAFDIIVCATRLINIQESDAKGTKMYFCTFESTYINQNGYIAFKGRQTLICR